MITSGANLMQKTFKRDLTSLDKIFISISQFISQNKIDESVSFTVSLAVEELFTNMVKYTPGDKEVLICLEKRNGQLIITLTDFGVSAYDITKADQVDVNKRLEERKPGGLGLHLVKQMMDDIKYEYKNRNSKITLIKHLE